MASGPEGHHLKRDVGFSRHLGQSDKLGVHHLLATDRAAQCRLVHHGPQPGPARLCEHFLPGQAQAHPALDLFGRRGGLSQPDHGPCVIGRLEQSGNELHLVEPYQRRCLFQSHVDLEPVGQDVAVLVPPAGRVRLLGQGDQGLGLLLVHAVEVKQVLYVALLEADPPQFHPADLGSRSPDRVSGVVPGNSLGLAQPAELGTQQDPQHGRATARLCRDHARSLSTLRQTMRKTFGRPPRHPHVH